MIATAPGSYRTEILPTWIVCTDADGVVRYDRLLAQDARIEFAEQVPNPRNPFGPAMPVAVRVGDGEPFCILAAGPHGHLPAVPPHVTDAWQDDTLLWSHHCTRS